MNALTPFVFEDNLVRIVEKDREPWFVGMDVCKALGLKNHRTSLERLDEDECDVHTMDVTSSETRARNTQEMIIISEPGVFRLIFTSRKPEAERFKRWLAHDVLPTLRKTGHYGLEPGQGVPISELEMLEGVPFAARVDAVRVYIRLYGLTSARAVWQRAIPELPAPTISNEVMQNDAGFECLSLILEIARPLIENEDIKALAAIGCKIVDLPANGLFIANRSPGLEKILQGTGFDKARWITPLRRLSGAIYGHGLNREMLEGFQVRGTFIPIRRLE